jgi:predicted ATPase
MLDRITLVNFKSAQNLEVPLSSLTVLSGFNGSGKSTALQSIALLRQSLDPHTDRCETLKLRGPLVQIGGAEDLLCENASNNLISIAIRCGANEGRVEATAFEPGQYVLGAQLHGDFEPFKAVRDCPFQYLQADRLTPRTHYERSDSFDTQRMGLLGAQGQFTPDYLANQGDRLEVSERRRCPISMSGVRSELIGRIVGTPRLSDQVSGWMQELSPGVRISASRLSATDLVSLKFQYMSTEIGHDSKFRRPANVGFGLTYSLPVVTALLASPPGTLLLLENPEAHLHPRGQAALGTLIARVASDGVQVLVETHSDHVLNGIRLAVKNGIVDSQACQLCNFVRDTETAASYIEAPSILPNGELSTWPVGFFDEWEKSLQALLT